MNVAVAVEAVTSDEIVAWVRSFEPGSVIVRGTRVARPVMTILAKVRRFGGQQLVEATAVRFMAGAAVLFNWRMLPDKGAALFSVAGVAELVVAVRTHHAVCH